MNFEKNARHAVQQRVFHRGNLLHPNMFHYNQRICSLYPIKTKRF